MRKATSSDKSVILDILTRSFDQQACALILFSDKKRTSFRTLLWDLKLASSVIGLNRVSAVLKREVMIRSNHPKEPIAYLWFIGVNPQLHGKGIDF